MAHELPKLSYAFDALEPHIDARTMEIHHGKHHQAYVTNLNAALDKQPDLHSKSLEDLLRGINSVPDAIRGAVRNNGGGHQNHSLFWTIMKKGGGGEPKGALADAIKATFGDFAKFKDTVTNNGITRFGSGWSWLVLSKGALKAYSTANQDSPLMEGDLPILGVDVWEHAYYLKYQNLRKSYLDAWWNVVNWDEVAARFAKAKQLNIVLVEPEIPPNTGNVARLCAATNSTLHLIGPLGFRLDDRELKRAGMDYWEHVTWKYWNSWDEFEAAARQEPRPPGFWLVENKTDRPYTSVTYRADDYLVFGRETTGLPAKLLENYRESVIAIPQFNPNARSLNLATAVAIVLYEAIRQVTLPARPS